MPSREFLPRPSQSNALSNNLSHITSTLDTAISHASNSPRKIYAVTTPASLRLGSPGVSATAIVVHLGVSVQRWLHSGHARRIDEVGSDAI